MPPEHRLNSQRTTAIGAMQPPPRATNASGAACSSAMPRRDRRVCGQGAAIQLNRRFAQLMSHHIIAPTACAPRSAAFTSAYRVPRSSCTRTGGWPLSETAEVAVIGQPN
jgi:hypothetical protein